MDLISNFLSQYLESNGKHRYYIKLDNKIIHTEINTTPKTFNDMKVYLADPWYNAASAAVRNFKYRKYDEFCLNYCP